MNGKNYLSSCTTDNEVKAIFRWIRFAVFVSENWIKQNRGELISGIKIRENDFSEAVVGNTYTFIRELALTNFCWYLPQHLYFLKNSMAIIPEILEIFT